MAAPRLAAIARLFRVQRMVSQAPGPRPATKASIARIRQERAAGRSYREIARRLDWAGMPCRGRRWSPSTVRAILVRAIATAANGLR
jgi:hypothetical protein